MIPIYEPDLTDVERDALLAAYSTGWISSQGQCISDFEVEFSKKFGMKYGVATSNCTTSLHLALVALGVGVGDEVICPDLTFIAPANMAALTGAKLILVDVEKDTWNIDPLKVRAAISNKTKAIIAVHAFGLPANMNELMKLSSEFGIPIIEDNAESPGAKFDGKLAGSFGLMSCYSFFANKIITTGEGGMILTNDQDIYFRLKELRDHGMSRHKRYFHTMLGFNYRMTNLQAAIGLAQLGRFEEIIKKRSAQKNQYYSLLSDMPEIMIRSEFSQASSVHWLTTIMLKDQSSRDFMLSYLKENGIDSRQMINPVHRALHFEKFYNPENFLNSTHISVRSMHLPSSTNLSSNDIEKICETIKKGLSQ